MLKVLVPTDFSGNSKKGMRFSLQWSAQQKIELIFIHVMQVILATRITDLNYISNAKNEETYYLEELNEFAKSLFRSMQIKPYKYSCVVIRGISADTSIIDYCRQRHDINYICMATRGAGKLNKLFGTHTGNLITKSDVPVIAVPHNYRKKPIDRILYASDFYEYKSEAKKVADFARPLKAKVEALHVAFQNELLPNKKTIAKTFDKNPEGSIHLTIANTDILSSLYEDLRLQIKRIKPSLIVMFTDQSRNFLQKIMFPSKAEKLSFETNIPLLVFKKG